MSHHQALVLVVAGHSLLRHGILLLLGKLPWATVCGQTFKAANARRLCEERRPDLIVLDMELGDGESLSLLKDLSRLHPEARTLALSEKEDSRWIQRIFKAGASGFVSKWDSEEQVPHGLMWLSMNKERFLGPRLSHFLLQDFLSADAPHIPKEKMSSLSDREMEVFSLIGEGQSTRVIAEHLRLSKKTIETHCHRIKLKLELRTGEDLKRRAAEWSIAMRPTVGN